MCRHGLLTLPYVGFVLNVGEKRARRLGFLWKPPGPQAFFLNMGRE